MRLCTMDSAKGSSCGLGCAKLLVRGAGAVAATLILSSVAAAQCAMCRTALTNSEEGQRWSRGIDHGILLLLAAPFLIVSRVLFSIYRPEIMAGLSAAGAPLRAAAARLSRRPARQRLETAPDSRG